MKSEHPGYFYDAYNIKLLIFQVYFSICATFLVKYFSENTNYRTRLAQSRLFWISCTADWTNGSLGSIFVDLKHTGLHYILPRKEKQNEEPLKTDLAYSLVYKELQKRLLVWVILVELFSAALRFTSLLVLTTWPYFDHLAKYLLDRAVARKVISVDNRSMCP